MMRQHFVSVVILHDLSVTLKVSIRVLNLLHSQYNKKDRMLG